MITEKQYLEALRIIDFYHRQKDNKRLTISAFITDLEKTEFVFKTRIINVLEQLKDKYVFLDSITRGGFLKVKNAGKKSYWIFREKQILALQTKILNYE